MAIKVLIAPNSFKGSASASSAFHAFLEGVYYFSNITSKKVETRKILVCDGGTGFSEIVGSRYPDSKKIEADFVDPLMRPLSTSYYKAGDIAVIESAKTIGHALLAKHELNPMHTSSYGLGQCISHAIDNGAKRILIGCGDSATSDCGIGMLAALGVTFIDNEGKNIEKPVGSDITKIKNFDFSTSKYYGCDVSVELACNLTSIASGPHSTALVYSRQKGASAKQAEQLFEGYKSYTSLVGERIGEPDLGLLPGTGAAGGIGFAVSAFFQRRSLRYSFDVVFDAIGIDPLLEWADIVITGEGLFDRNSVKGKAPVAVALRAKLYDTITVGVVGAIQSNIISRVLRSGFDILEPFSSENISLDSYCNNFSDIARDATVRALLKAIPLMERTK